MRHSANFARRRNVPRAIENDNRHQMTMCALVCMVGNLGASAKPRRLWRYPGGVKRYPTPPAVRFDNAGDDIDAVAAPSAPPRRSSTLMASKPPHARQRRANQREREKNKTNGNQIQHERPSLN